MLLQDRKEIQNLTRIFMLLEVSDIWDIHTDLADMTHNLWDREMSMTLEVKSWLYRLQWQLSQTPGQNFTERALNKHN